MIIFFGSKIGVDILGPEGILLSSFLTYLEFNTSYSGMLFLLDSRAGI